MNAVTLFLPNNPFGKLFWILVLIVAGFMAISSGGGNHPANNPATEAYVMSSMELTYDQIRIIEIVSGHAWTEHGSEVNDAIKCLKNNGTWKSFRTSGFTDFKTNRNVPTNLWICFDGKDFYAVVTTYFEKIAQNQVARLVTAYKISKDVFPLIDDYINYIKEKWQAGEINYVIQAGSEILLDPK